MKYQHFPPQTLVRRLLFVFIHCFSLRSAQLATCYNFPSPGDGSDLFFYFILLHLTLTIPFVIHRYPYLFCGALPSICRGLFKRRLHHRRLLLQ